MQVCKIVCQAYEGKGIDSFSNWHLKLIGWDIGVCGSTNCIVIDIAELILAMQILN